MFNYYNNDIQFNIASWEAQNTKIQLVPLANWKYSIVVVFVNFVVLWYLGFDFMTFKGYGFYLWCVEVTYGDGLGLNQTW